MIELLGKFGPFYWIKNYMASQISANIPFRIKMNVEDFTKEIQPILNIFGLTSRNTSSNRGYTIIEFNPENTSVMETVDISSDIEGTKQYIADNIHENRAFIIKMNEKYFDEHYSTLINEMNAWGLVSFENELVTIQQK